MDKFVIEGGKKLKGEVHISGAKNAALPILTATILTNEACLISNVPKLKDIDTVKKLIAGLGSELEFQNSSVRIKAGDLNSFEAPYDLVKTMRASVLFLGPLLARCGRAKVSLPGGCAIGARPINLHLDGLKKLGAEISLEGGYIKAKAKKLRGTKIHFDMPTVTGTMNLMMASVFADGQTVLENCAQEPEVAELGRFLGAMGAKIKGEGSSVIEIQGVTSLNGADYKIIPDRIETGTYIAASAITGSSITLSGVDSSIMESVNEKFVEMGVNFENISKDKLAVIGPEYLNSVDISTAPYPGFPTDMQAQFMALMAVAKGSSVITENIFEGRFMHAAELRRMGANIKRKGSSCIVKGVPSLIGAPVMATDLRASASLVLAALRAKGKTEIRRIYHLDRGYEKMEGKLEALGARVTREKE